MMNGEVKKSLYKAVFTVQFRVSFGFPTKSKLMKKVICNFLLGLINRNFVEKRKGSF